MNKEIKIGLVQQSNTADRAANIEKLKRNIRACVAQGAELVVLQELHNGCVGAFVVRTAGTGFVSQHGGRHREGWFDGG